MFKQPLACLLMPNHYHLLSASLDPERDQWRVSVELRAWTRKFFPGRKLWEHGSSPEEVPTNQLTRVIRYIHLNPCRAGLARDPLEWVWSTHRDITGCVERPWVDRPLLRRLFGVIGDTRLAQAAHLYISSDPTAAVAGTPPPREPNLGEPLRASVSAVLLAVRDATRTGDLPLTRGPLRDSAIQLCERLKIPRAEGLAAIGVDRLTWLRASRRTGADATLLAALRILSDERLQKRLGAPRESVPLGDTKAFTQ